MAPEPKHLVCVIIAVKNGAPHIVEAVESALAQGPLVDQVIVVDDGSTDGTLEALAVLSDRRLSLLHSPDNGVSAARNAGAALSRASWLLFLDADDRLAPAAVERLVSRVEEGLVLVYGDYERVDEQGQSFGNRGLLRRARGKPSGAILEALLAQNLFINGGVLICAREAFLQVGGFERSLSLCEDWHLWCRLATLGAVRYVPERVLDYRVHSASVMMRKRRTYEDFAPALRAIFTDSRIGDRVAPERLSRLRRYGEISLMTYCAQQSLRAGNYGEVTKMALTALCRDPSRAPWVVSRIAGAWASL